MWIIRNLFSKEKNQYTHTWPTATVRIESAKTATKVGKAWIPAKAGTGVQFCIDKDVATAFLVDHEDAQECPVRSLKLHKTTKENTLLRDALTNVNGDDWRRQRPLVQKALNNREIRKLSQQASRSAVLKHTSARVGDVRRLALDIALETCSVAVVSSVHADRLPLILGRLFDETLLPIRGNVEISRDLNKLVQSIVNDIQSTPTRSPCFAACLLEQESPTGLSHSEVISNVHSALLAGTQTMATTLTTALLLLSSGPETLSRSLCHEALQQLPPVATLPRCSADDPSSIFMIDLLAIAHAGDSPCPWGLGDRKCPAGSLSVDCVTEALDAFREHWTIAQAPIKRKNLMRDVSYRPTVSFAKPIPMRLKKRN